MKVAAFAFASQASASEVSGGTIALTYQDCGDSSTHGKITDLTPTSFALGDDVTLTGSGTLDTDVSGGSFLIHLEADGLVKQDWTGDVCEAKQFKLPLGLGSISWSGMSCPVAAGSLSVPIGLKMSSVVPAKLASGTIAASGTVSNGDKFFCVDAQFQKQAEAQVTGGTIALTYSDCGDSSTHGKITDLQPTSFALGDDVTLTGSGTLDADVSGGTFLIHLEADGLVKQDWTGDVCEAKQFKLPLGLGSISWSGMSCPVAAGSLSVPIGLKMSSVVPAKLASGTIAASGTVSNGDSFFCVNAQFQKQAEAQVTGGTIALTYSDCGDSSTHGKITDLQPTSFALGDDVTLTGSGTLDADVSGGSFLIHLEADGLVKQDWTGDVCEAKQFKLPLGLGSISWSGMSCPVAAGSLSVPIGLKMSSVVPAKLASGTIAASGTVSNGDSFFCVNAQFQKQDVIV